MQTLSLLLAFIDPMAIVPEFDMFNKLGAKFFIRLLINIVSMIILIRFIYYPVYRKRTYFFTYFMFNLVIYIITFLMNKVELSMGAAFGLFAVFSLLRYRTANISAKDMTYLFVVIAMGLISAVAKGNYFELGLVNALFLFFAYLLDGNFFIKRENTQKIQYENIDLIKPENRQSLLNDLRRRTGLNIYKVSISKIDFMKDSAVVKVYYHEEPEKEIVIEGETPQNTAANQVSQG
jgi:hypothetical protein